MLLIHPSCLTSLKQLFKWSLKYPSYQNTCIILFRQQKSPYKHKSLSLLLFICLIEKKFHKLGKSNCKRSSSNSDKLGREMTFQKRYLKKFSSKSTKIPIFMKNLEMSFNTSLIIAKILKKFHKPKYTNTLNVIGNILHHNRLSLKNHQRLQFAKQIFLKTWEHVLLSLLTC